MEISTGSLYFVSDDFFAKIQDPYLKINYEDTKRPHYFAYRDCKTGLYWLVPCSSKIEKFERLILKKQEQHKPTDTIKIVKIFDRKTVLLFQDMFPVIARYIDGRYIKGGQPVRIADPKQIQELEKNANKIINLLHRGVRFIPTQPDIIRIEKIMLEELKDKKITYRKALKDDANLLIDIYNASFYDDYVRYGMCPAYGKTKEEMESSIEDSTKYIVLFETIPVGAISLFEEKKGYYYLGCLCVVPEYQGRGIGTQAFQYILSVCSDWKQITLVTPVDKEQNIKFYTERCGFHIGEKMMDGEVEVVNFYMKR